MSAGWSCNLEQILGYHASLLPGAEDFRLLNNKVGILGKTVAVAARAGCDSLGHDGVASFANLVKLRFRGYFCGFRCSLAERHTLFSSDLTELHSDFWVRPTKNVHCSALSLKVPMGDEIVLHVIGYCLFESELRTLISGCF